MFFVLSLEVLRKRAIFIYNTINLFEEYGQ